MYQNKMIIIFVAILLTGDCLEEIPSRDDILKTEVIVQKTINGLFSTLKLKRIQQRPNILEYTTLHKYFASLSMQDDYNLQKILQLTKINKEHKFYNGTDFIAVINEIINEDIVNRINVDDMSVISYIERFISRLKKLREMYAPKTIYVNINFKVLEHLRNTVNKSFDFKSKNNLITSDNEFWEPSGRRIYRGQRTKIKYFPFMASVHIFNNFHCAGSIIKSDLIITASSCLQLAWNNRLFRENPAFLSVRVGSSFYSGGGEVIPVLEIYFHPGYDPKSLRNNICILRLVRRLNFQKRNKRVKRINIDTNPWNLPMNTPGVTILGWGAKGSSGIIYDPWKNILSYSILDIYPLADCRDVYSRRYVTRKHFCAGFLSKGGGACNRDVGAPGVVDGKLMGVVSFGSPTCGTPDAPTVFTKLGYYTDWIEDVMEKPVPVSLKRTTKKELFNIFNIIPTERSTTTTFKIPPLTGNKLEPISIHNIDKSLRNIDENLFKEFVSTMFTSSEIDKYLRIIRQQQKTKGNVENKTAIDNVNSDTSIDKSDVVFVTKAPDFGEAVAKAEDIETQDSESDNGDERNSQVQSQESYRSKENQAIADDSKVEGDIIQFMKNIDLKKIIQEEVMDTSKAGNNGSFLKLAYLNDTDKTGQGDNLGENDGLSLVGDNRFEDMTRSKLKSTNRNLPENEVYGLLSDVIEEEVQNKLVKGFKYFGF
ncbi:uncharacterized protein LOC123714462 isoform X1 [Pieris brassicae]|uniref:uncharacterized protein LOC123714462 isoform X1 n=2 Tax=Pieris brassicae TaxID=7116 RepID=UPI001E66111C|nr:uncharacterized protein LOC123714462 isoform X1 [Pieris brassicae]